MKTGKKWMIWAALALVFLACIGVRAVAFRLPGIPETDRDAFRDETGAPYLTELDSYYYLRLAAEMAEGRGTFWYNHRLVDPLMGGRNMGDTVVQGDPLFLSVLAYWIWRVLSVFGPVSLIGLARWMGPVFGALACVPAFLYVRKRTNLAGGITAGLLAGLAVPFVVHTHAGFFDTDMLLGVLPLTMMLSLASAMEEKSWRRQLLFAVLSAAAYALISVTWVAYYMYFWLIVLGGVLGMVFAFLFAFRSAAKRKLQVLRGFAMTLGLTLAALALIRGQPGFRALGSVFATFRAVSGSSNAFPFVHAYTTEMGATVLAPSAAKDGILSLFAANTQSVTSGLGGLVPLAFGAAAIPLCLLYARRKRRGEGPVPAWEEKIAAGIDCGILLPWLLIGIKLAVSSRRFMEIAVLPLAVLAGLSAGRAASLVRNGKARAAAAALLAAAAVVPMAAGAWQICSATVPSANDNRQQAMEWIRETQPENTAIASWWDDGYFTQYTARRRSIADGGSTSSALNYFLGKALLTDDPAQMAGILRMLETSGTRAVDLLKSEGFSDAETMAMLLELAPMTREEAAARLQQTAMGEAARETLLGRTHPEERVPLLLLLGGEYLRKLEAIGYYGQWDPEKPGSAESLYWMISSGSGTLAPGGTCELRMQDPAIVMTAVMDAGGHVSAGLQKAGKPYHLSAFSWWKDGVCLQDETLDGTGPSLMLVEENGRVTAFSAHPLLHRSMLARLYVAKDRELDGIRLLGEWSVPAEDGGVPGRLKIVSMADWAVQVWELDNEGNQ